MGWDGIPMRRCPKGKERIMEATKGYTWEDEDRRVTLLDAALVGTTVYAAVEVVTKKTGKRDVRASVILTQYDKRDKHFYKKHIGEESGPVQYKCPNRILNMLTPIESEWANEWRKFCREHHKKQAESTKKSPGALPVGTVIRLRNPQRTILTVRKNPYSKRKEYVGEYCRATAQCVNSWGWDVIEEAKS